MTHEDALAMIDVLRNIVFQLFGLGVLLFAMVVMLASISMGLRGRK